MEIKQDNSRINIEAFLGTRVGNVIIVEYLDKIRKGSRFWYYYKYLCDCGRTGTSTRHTLIQSTKRNKYCCNQCRKDKLAVWAKKTCTRYLDPVEGKCATLFSNYRSKCKIKGWNFNLTFNEFKILVQSNCHYCDLAPNKYRLDRAKSRAGISRIYFNGIDRLDSSKGYELINVVPCCEDCNKAKRNLSYTQFLDLVKRIYDFKNLALVGK